MSAVIKAQHTISMGHRLPSYDGICSSPHGHNVTVEAHVLARRFFDFKELKDALVKIIDDMDHAMVLFEEDPLVQVMVDFNFRHVVLSKEPTTENIAQYIFDQLHRKMQSNGLLDLLEVKVHETEKYSAAVTAYSGSLRRVYRTGQ